MLQVSRKLPAMSSELSVKNGSRTSNRHKTSLAH